MKSGKIKKTTSYIMAIPMNDKDIDTPQMVYDRINAHDEFELKETSFDDKNMCPMVTVVYKGQQYIVDIKIEPVNITPERSAFFAPFSSRLGIYLTHEVSAQKTVNGCAFLCRLQRGVQQS